MLPLITTLNLIVALYQAFSIGANDETTAPIVSGRALGVKEAVVCGSIVGLVGAIFLGESCQNAIGTGLLVKPITAEVALIVMFSSSLWLTVVSYKGYSVSTTHSTIGAILGIGFFVAGLGDVNWLTVSKIIGGWLISMPIGLLGSYIVTKTIDRIKRRGVRDQEKIEKMFSKLLIFSTFCLQFSRWGNDVGNASGMLLAIGIPPLLARTICALFMALGLIILGRIVIRAVGLKMVRLTPSAAFASQVIATPIIFLFALIGIPLSGTHVMISSIYGAGMAIGAKINTRILKGFILAWILSFICPGILTVVIMKLAL